MNETDLPLPELDPSKAPPPTLREEADHGPKTAGDLEAMFDVPVSVSAVLGRTKLEVGDLMNVEDKLGVTMTEIIKGER